ncbi:MAG: DNA mismatch repair endonuclease MutL [bacterium]|nr:DNA mismatch repair endonuclease MutL [bacterium]
MSKIVQLDEHLSNMIAAGEVVERVSSVVKELIENSLDAKSSEITIELVDSGIREIKVTDNGIGMDKEDLKISYLRHATSKIKNQYDLFRISTLGFRGEALPSIASVSDMTIKSNDGSIGYYIHLRASKLMDEGIISLNKGTEVTVCNLFFNTPARLKYLKNENV